MNVLPAHLRDALEQANQGDDLLEIVLDLGRKPEARFTNRELTLSEAEVTLEDIDYVLQRIGQFTDDNRAGIERTLHRISAIRNRQADIVGLTCRVGRAVYGTIDIIQDIVESGENILLFTISLELESKPGKVRNMISPCTLVSMDRSGSTFLMNVLGRHPELACYPKP